VNFSFEEILICDFLEIKRFLRRLGMLLGEILIKEGYCTIEDIRKALKRQENGDNRRVGEILLDMGAITLEQLENALRLQWNSSGRS